MRLVARMLVEMPEAQHAHKDAIFLEILWRVGRLARIPTSAFDRSTRYAGNRGSKCNTSFAPWMYARKADKVALYRL
jgi:hypothetical protein